MKDARRNFAIQTLTAIFRLAREGRGCNAPAEGKTAGEEFKFLV